LDESLQKNCQQSWIKLTMNKQNLRVLTRTEFDFIETRKWNGVYNNKTREELYAIIKKLKREKNFLFGDGEKTVSNFSESQFWNTSGKEYTNSG
jgi:hypothetical protein